MLANPLAKQPLKHPDADLVLVEGAIEAAAGNERLLIAPSHRHLEDDEIFYVLEGTIGFQCDQEEYLAKAGDAVLIPRSAVHTWWNVGPDPARYLIAMPRRIDDLINRIHERSYSWTELKQLFADHAAELIED